MTTDPAAWRGSDLTTDRSWVVELSDAHRRELLAAATSGELPSLEPELRDWRRRLQHGYGILLVRGVPVEDLGEQQARDVFALLGRHLGDPVSQNKDGELITDIRDVGNDPSDPEVRLYTTAAEQDFHTDGADLIGLLCLRSAREGGLNRVVSSVTVYDEVARRRPDLAALLLQDWHFFLHTQPDGTPLTFAMPIVRQDGDRIVTFFIPWYIRRAQGLPGVPDLTPEQDEALRLYEETANRPDLYLDMDFRPGDMQWIRNAVVLHKRTAYVDWPEPERRRHLLRLWLTAREFADGDDLLRAGIPQA
ncbi:MAG: TauD/TfdA family dioxygenase [Frankiaceae bacterium]|nr:TauD/TfdA family dioxygenase [Frankiaceae bacterium]